MLAEAPLVHRPPDSGPLKPVSFNVRSALGSERYTVCPTRRPFEKTDVARSMAITLRIELSKISEDIDAFKLSDSRHTDPSIEEPLENRLGVH